MFNCCCKKKKNRNDQCERTKVTPINADESTVDSASQRPISASQVSPEVNTYSYDHRSKERKEKKKAKKSNLKILKAEDEDLKREKHEIEQETEKMREEHVKSLKDTNERHYNIIKDKDDLLSKQALDIEKLTAENEALRTRLSAIASAKLTDGNANIADLSDENRASKLAERYSELYDNEWTDALELLTNHGTSEKNACLILLKALCVTFIKCKEKAEQDLKTLTDAAKNFLGDQEPAVELIKPFKDMRKKIFHKHGAIFKKEIKGELKRLLPDKGVRTNPRMKKFLNNCLELCWLMVIQDPPVFMDVVIECSGKKYDTNVYKHYTKSGKYIDYIVWPPIYLQEGGSILCKGVAQGTSIKAHKETTVTMEQSQSSEVKEKQNEGTMTDEKQNGLNSVKSPEQLQENSTNKNTKKENLANSVEEVDIFNSNVQTLCESKLESPPMSELKPDKNQTKEIKSSFTGGERNRVNEGLMTHDKKEASFSLPKLQLTESLTEGSKNTEEMMNSEQNFSKHTNGKQTFNRTVAGQCDSLTKPVSTRSLAERDNKDQTDVEENEHCNGVHKSVITVKL